MNHLAARTFLIATLLLTAAADAADFTVGPDGEYTAAQLQTAIDDAFAGPLNTVKIQAGVTASTIIGFDATTPSAGLLEISGGWDATFSEQIAGPEATVLSGGSPVLLIAMVDPVLLIVGNLTIRDGDTVSSGAGVRVDIDAGFLLLDRVVVRNNTVSTVSGEREGAGIYAFVNGSSSSFSMIDSLIVNNSISTSGSAAVGAGIYISVGDEGEVFLRGNTVRDNSGSGSEVSGINGYLRCNDDSMITDERNRWLEGVGAGETESVYLDTVGSCSGISLSSLVAGSPGTGYRVRAGATSTARINNLTAADNGDDGMWISNANGTATVSVANSILFDNAGSNLVTLGGTISQLTNLVGVDPDFFHPPSRDYSPRFGSPAIDAGTNEPPGGLSEFDIEGRDRIAFGPTEGVLGRTAVLQVDIGAWEGPFGIFTDGFESGDTSEWSTTTP